MWQKIKKKVLKHIYDKIINLQKDRIDLRRDKFTHKNTVLGNDFKGNRKCK